MDIKNLTIEEEETLKEEWYQVGLKALEDSRPAEAVEKFLQILELDSNYRDVGSLLRQAEVRRNLQENPSGSLRMTGIILVIMMAMIGVSAIFIALFY